MLSFNLTYVYRELNVVDDKLVIFSFILYKQHSHDRPNCDVISLYHPYVLGNEESSQIFENYEDICHFLTGQGKEYPDPWGVINPKNNIYAKDLVPLENMFSTNDTPNNFGPTQDPSKQRIGPTIPINIGFEEDPIFLYIGPQCTK